MKVLKIALLSTVAFYSVSSIAAVSLDQGDTMYYFAKDCNKKGKTSYGNTDYGWQPYSASDVYQEYKYMLDMVDLKNRRNHLPKELSGGQAQRVAIARALIDNPKIVLADEPTGNLDSKTGESILNLLKELNRVENITVIVVTHDKKISDKTDRVITLVDGKNV